MESATNDVFPIGKDDNNMSLACSNQLDHEDSFVLCESWYRLDEDKIPFPPNENDLICIEHDNKKAVERNLKRIRPVYEYIGLDRGDLGGIWAKQPKITPDSNTITQSLMAATITTAAATTTTTTATTTSRSRRRARNSTDKSSRSNSTLDDTTTNHNHPTVSVENDHKSSRLGDDYQVSFLPTASNSATFTDWEGDVIWDPIAADQARLLTPNDAVVHPLDQMINRPMSLLTKILLMKSLHETEYNTHKATTRFIQLVQKSTTDTDNPYALLSEQERESLQEFYRTQPKKDFKAIAQLLSIPLDTVIVSYYVWKGSKPKEYKAVKKRRKIEGINDYCEICDDGGSLIECDLCRKAYHLECLSPPLTQVPEGMWYCDNCIVRSPARIRSLHRAGNQKSPHDTTNQSLALENELLPPLVGNKSPPPQQHSSPPPPPVARMGNKSPPQQPPVGGGNMGNNNSPKQQQEHQVGNKSRTTNSAKRDVLPGEYYNATIPFCQNQDLLISVGFDRIIGGIIFLGYRRMKNGQMGYAETNEVFKGQGDVVCAINGVNIEGMTWEQAISMFSTAKRRRLGNTFLMRRNSSMVRNHKPFAPPENSYPLQNVAKARKQPSQMKAALTALSKSAITPLMESQPPPTKTQTVGQKDPKIIDLSSNSPTSKNKKTSVPIDVPSLPSPRPVILPQMARPPHYSAPTLNGPLITMRTSAPHPPPGVPSIANGSPAVTQPPGQPGTLGSTDNPASTLPIHQGAAVASTSQPPSPSNNAPMPDMGIRPGSHSPIKRSPHNKTSGPNGSLPELNGDTVSNGDERNDGTQEPKRDSSLVLVGEISITGEEETLPANQPLLPEPAGPQYVQYVARVPVTSDGLCLVISEVDGVAVFTDYRRLRDGTPSPAMLMNPKPFKKKGDQIVAIDSVPCVDLVYDKIIDLLLDNEGKKFRDLRMRSRIGE